MSTTLSNPSISAGISATIESGLLSGTITHRPAAQSPSVGTNAGNVNLIYSADFTVTSGSPLSLDLSSIADAAGNVVTFGHITHFLAENRSTNTAEIMSLFGGTNGVFTADPKPLQANGGLSFMANPNPGVTIDGTHKIVTVTVAAGTSVPGRLTIIGRTT
jgi:hypothetical protein